MPLTMHTVSLTTTEPDGVTPIDGVWTLSILSQKGTLKNLETGTVAAGKRKQETVAGHTQFSLPALPQANIAPADATYRLHFNASGKRAGSFTTDPFTLTANRTLTDLYLESGLPITPSVLSETLAAAERAETAAAEVDAKVAGIPSMDTLSTTFASKVDPAGVDFAGPLTVNGEPVGTGGTGDPVEMVGLSLVGEDGITVVYDDPTDTITLSGARRVLSTASTATLTIDADAHDAAKVTAQAAALTIAAPVGTPTPMQGLVIRLTDDGTARALTWNAAFRGLGATLPTTTVLGKTTYVGAVWNSEASKWDVLAVAQEA